MGLVKGFRPIQKIVLDYSDLWKEWVTSYVDQRLLAHCALQTMHVLVYLKLSRSKLECAATRLLFWYKMLCVEHIFYY